MIELSPHLQECLDPERPFEAVLGLEGEVFRQHKHRRTLRVELDGRTYFVKIHGHTSSKELLKHAMRLRSPVLTAENEREAIERLDALGVPTVRIAGYGCRGKAPGRLESFIITDELRGTSLAELSADWGGLTGRARTRLQRGMIGEVARIARNLHRNGLNHRDFYLCHFLVPHCDWERWTPGNGGSVRVIDLHRAQVREQVPTRWVVKDLAGLLFSALDAGLTDRDYLRFLTIYFDRPWRRIVTTRRRFLRRVVRRAVRLYRSEHGRAPQLPAGLASFA